MDATQIDLEKKRFQEAVNFLKKTKVNKNSQLQTLHQVDWYIVAGADKTGKTSLLKNSDLHFYLSRKAELVQQHQELNWWVSKEAVFLDLPAAILSDEKISLQNLLSKLIKKYSYKKRLRGILLVISVKDIIQLNAEKKEEFCKSINIFLENITRKFSQPVPVYLLINKCDLVSGFQEFFGAYAKDERQQAWGFPLLSSGKITEETENEFNHLLQRLNQQLIWRLHHEPDLDKRNAIKDFPVQFAHLKNHLTEFITGLCANWQSTYLSGIYFTSAVQNTAINNPNSTQTSLIVKTNNPSKAYFIHDLLEKTIVQSTENSKQQVIKQPNNPFIYIAAFAVIGAAALLFSLSYNTNSERSKEATQLLQEYENNNQVSTDLYTEASNIKYLATANSILQPQHSWQTFLPGAHQNAVLASTISKIYNKQLNHFLLPTIKETLENALTSNTTDPALLYATLKTYLMLSNRNQFNGSYFYQTIATLWQQNKNSTLTLPLLNQLQQILQQHYLSANINPQIVTNARNILTQLPTDDLAFAIVKSNFTNQPLLTLNLSANKTAGELFALRDTQVGISSFYTSNVYKQLNGNLFNLAAYSALRGDWVLGLNNTQTGITPEQLSLQLRQEYVMAYAKAWHAFIDNIQIKSFNNFDDLHTALTSLGSTSSPLIQLIQLIKSNVPQEIINTDPELNSLANIQFNGQGNTLQNILTATSALNTYLKPDSNKAIFNLTKQRFLNNGNNDPIANLFNLSSQYPAPFQYWLYQIATNSWQLMLNQTTVYINQEWQNNIWPQYLSQINNRYPFSANASQEVSIDSFINFFAVDGLMDHFYTNYLQDFINTNTNPWQLKSLNGAALNIKSSTLHTFSHAIHLQHLFFPNSDKHLFLPFTIEPVKFSDNLYAAVIKLGNQQTILYSNQAPASSAFRWPDDANQTNFIVTFYHKDKSTNVINFSGPWALWHFMQASNLIPSQQPKHWDGSITRNDDTLQFLISTQHKTNVFDATLFAYFKPGETL